MNPKVPIALATVGILAFVAFAIVPLAERTAHSPGGVKSAEERAAERAERAAQRAERERGSDFKTLETLPLFVEVAASNEAAKAAAPAGVTNVVHLLPAGELGEIRKIVYSGDTNVLAGAGITEMIAEQLCDGMRKSADDVTAVLDFAVAELKAAGTRDVTLAPTGAEAYDATTKTLSVLIERNRRLIPEARRRAAYFVRHSKDARVAVTNALASSAPVGDGLVRPGAAQDDVSRLVEIRDRRGVRLDAQPGAGALPQAGPAGGADVVRRALAQTDPAGGTQPVSVDRPLVMPLKVAAQTGADGAEFVKIGRIRHVNLSGPEDFIAEHALLTKLKERLCDGLVKTVGNLRDELAAVRAELVEKGFLLATLAPASAKAYHADTQTIDLTVSPGTYGDIVVTFKETAGGWHSKAQVERFFKNMRKDEPFNYNTFRQSLRKLNGHPDFQADASLAVAESNATRRTNVELSVDDSFPLHAALSFDNSALEELDRWQTILLLQYLNLTGADDTLSFSPAMTLNREMWSVAGSYRRPFDFLLGGNWSVYGGYSKLDSDEVDPRLELVGTGAFAGLATSWNLVDNDRRNLAFNLGLQWRHFDDQWSADVYDLGSRELDVLPLTFGFSYADQRRDALGGLDYLSLGESVNLLAKDDDFAEFSYDADPRYWIFRGNWSRLQPISGPEADGEEWRCWSLFSKVEGQYSEQTLLTAERMAFGGSGVMRGYRTRGYLGDCGIYGSFELRTPVFCDTIASFFRDGAGASAIDRFQFYGFTDLGDPMLHGDYNNFKKHQFLWSAGVGLRAGLTKYLSLNLDVAFPLQKAYADDQDHDCEAYFFIKALY